jgi:hypothetical protein
MTNIEEMQQRDWDLIVIGGGFAGAAAAIAAARQGLHVLLCDQAGYLGGAACNCLVNPFMRYWNTDEDHEALSRGIFEEILNEMRKIDGGDGIAFREETLKLVLDRMTVRSGVHVLLHVTLCTVQAEEGRVRSASFMSKTGMLNFHAAYFIDATGDADLCVMAGFRTQLGRKEDQLCQPMTLCFRIANVDMDAFYANRPRINQIYQQFQREGKIRNPRENVLIFVHPVRNMLHFNTTRIVKLNPVDPFDLTRAEMEAREQMFEMVSFLKENIPGFEHADLAFSAPQIGVRESRMIEGEYVMTGDDVLSGRKFEDSISAGNYDIDIHNPEGTGTDIYSLPKGAYYTIPYRSLVPKGSQNLLVAGRCISADHAAQASVRIMPICATLGEAAGVAAAVASKDHTDVGTVDIQKVQCILKENNAFLGI